MGIGCYWTLPAEEGGNTDRYLEPGQSFRYPFHETPSPVRWSGTIWGSTGCDKIDGCATGVCYSPSTDHVCPSYVGPGGPTTKAEFTLGDADKDYYDISAIDGVNLPMMIEPDNPVYPEDTSLATILKVSKEDTIVCNVVRLSFLFSGSVEPSRNVSIVCVGCIMRLPP